MPYANNKGTSAQSDQHLCCSLRRYYNTSSVYIWTVKPLPSVCGCAGWFESYLVAKPRRQAFSWHGSYTVPLFPCSIRIPFSRTYYNTCTSISRQSGIFQHQDLLKVRGGGGARVIEWSQGKNKMLYCIICLNSTRQTSEWATLNTHPVFTIALWYPPLQGHETYSSSKVSQLRGWGQGHRMIFHKRINIVPYGLCYIWKHNAL